MRIAPDRLGMPPDAGARHLIGSSELSSGTLTSVSSGVWSLAAKEKNEGVASTDKKGAARKPRRNGESHIGQALRSVWDETLGEQVPADMLDLLGKLN
jgi:hypothetical protein